MKWLQILRKLKHHNRAVSFRIGAGCCSTKITPSAAEFQPPGIVARQCIDFYSDEQPLIVKNLRSVASYYLRKIANYIIGRSGKVYISDIKFEVPQDRAAGNCIINRLNSTNGAIV